LVKEHGDHEGDTERTTEGEAVPFYQVSQALPITLLSLLALHNVFIFVFPIFPFIVLSHKIPKSSFLIQRDG
jgi:hypothetical protein